MSRICKEDHALGAAIIFVDVDVKMFDAFAIVTGPKEGLKICMGAKYQVMIF